MRHTIRTDSRRRGVSLIYTAAAMVVFLGFCTLGVDWGRVQLAKTELGRAADAAARYAVSGMSDGTALDKANWIGGQNTVDGQPLVFQASDVESGTWDSNANTFTANTAYPNAIRVTARRSVATVFGAAIGAANSSVTVQSVAKYNVVGFGVIGLNYINMGGNSSDSYWSGGGTGMGNNGNVGSNGNITLGGASSIHGDVYHGPGKNVSGGSVTGSNNTLATPLSYPNASPGFYAFFNSNGAVPSWAMQASSFKLGSNKSVTLPGGIYYFNNFDMAGGSSLSFTGPATIYCYGNFSMAGNTDTSGSKPGNLTVIMGANTSGGGPGSLTISSSAALYATVYAPQSAVTLSGSGDIYGSVLGLSIDMTGSSAIHYDLALNSNNGTISLVQ